MPNRLINETSPYLYQHAHNPVDWYPWGTEAKQRALKENKPVLLSIGYSACHWCHVMERESFENPDIAAVMNEHFINIKVDREERPDLDSIYMAAVQTLTGRGGWPMTVFLTPNLQPFFGGTYFPPVDRTGLPGFGRVLVSIAEAYRTRQEEVIEVAQRLSQDLGVRGPVATTDGTLTETTLSSASHQLATQFDSINGGFGSAPKFPQPMILEFLLRSSNRFGEKESLGMAGMSLERMAMGGIYDHLGGGFHRYTQDPSWLVPHFEKMLYDNALLAEVYLHAFQATGAPQFRRVTEETLDYILRDMCSPQGGFYTAQDADSENQEGKFYLWTKGEILQTMGPEDGEFLSAYFGVTSEGNFEEMNILSLSRDEVDLASAFGYDLIEAESIIARGKASLHAKRRKRSWPLRDEKILTSWNALVLKSLAEAAVVLDRHDYLDAATANAKFLLGVMKPETRLLRSYSGGQAKFNGYLEDYAFLIDGLISLYEASFKSIWLDEAISLTNSMLEIFWEGDERRFYDTGRDHEELFIRPRDLFDNAIPCGSSVATMVLARLGTLTENAEYREIATSIFPSVQSLLTQHPFGFGNWLSALDYYLSVPKEIVIVGTRRDPATSALLTEVHSRFLPNKVVVGLDPTGEVNKNLTPLLANRTMIHDKPTAYVCQNYTCQLPVTDPKELWRQLHDPDGPTPI